MTQERIKVRLTKDSPYSDYGYYERGDIGYIDGYVNNNAVIILENGKFAKADLRWIEVVNEEDKNVNTKLAESEDERIRKELLQIVKENEDSFYMVMTPNKREKLIAWLEKQGSEPNWYHHKVDLPNCSEEYRKAYYDGWNNCSMQYSQCKSEGNDVVKCLINGMKFYYEDNEEATWGTEKFSMKVKDILSWLEKQGKDNIGISEATKQKLEDNLNKALEKETPESWNKFLDGDEQKPAWSEEDKQYLLVCKNALAKYQTTDKWDAGIISRWLENKLKAPQNTWKPSDEQMNALDSTLQYSQVSHNSFEHLNSLFNDLKKLKGE